MKIVVDTSFLLSLYLTDGHSETARVQVIETGHPLIISPLARLEFTNGLEQWIFRKQITELQALQLKQCFLYDLEQGRLILGGNISAQCWQDARRLSEQFTKNLGARTLDILHVSFALEMKATDFWSFDLKQRKLAKESSLELNLMG